MIANLINKKGRTFLKKFQATSRWQMVTYYKRYEVKPGTFKILRKIILENITILRQDRFRPIQIWFGIRFQKPFLLLFVYILSALIESSIQPVEPREHLNMLLAPACSCAPIYLLKPGINSLGASPSELKEANMLDISLGGREGKEI